MDNIMDSILFDKIFKELKPIQSPDELKWLISHVEKINPTTIIEVGVENGGTFKYWEQILLSNPHLPKTLIGVDTVNNIRWNIKLSPCHVHIVIDDSTKTSTINTVRTLLNNKKADFLFIDGGHEEKTVRLDYNNYEQFVRKNGIIGFHDINDSVGVKQFWDKLTVKKESFTSLKNGIGIGFVIK